MVAINKKIVIVTTTLNMVAKSNQILFNPNTATQQLKTRPLQPPSFNPLHPQEASPTFQPDYPVSIAQAIVPPHIDHSICLGLVFRDLD